MLQSNQDEKGVQLDEKGGYQDMGCPEKIDCRASWEVIFLPYHPNDKYISLWNRFLCEATYIISYRFLREATGSQECYNKGNG
jgi:hypothetical protein